MTLKALNRMAAFLCAALISVALVDVAGVLAQVAPTTELTATKCGSGTITECGSEPIETCDWDIQIGFTFGSNFGIRIVRSDCKVIGSRPLYKDNRIEPFDPQLCIPTGVILGLPTGCRKP